ncbi:MAG: carbonic anhydrase [Streptosporangiales bacterium]|nr:carbonic anhydrase [Streptosporangiales bacterium]
MRDRLLSASPEPPAHPRDDRNDQDPPRAVLKRVLRADVPASLVVFLVAVPLSLGIAVASGAPIMAGLIAAVVGGVVAGAAGGSPLQVSGPAAGLTVIVAELVATYGWRATCAITLLAGLVQIALGTLRVARAALAISPAVIHGMLAGIGVVIALAQLHVVLGGSPQSSAVDNLLELPGQVVRNHGATVLLGLLTIAVLLVWSRLPGPLRRLRTVPAPLAAIAAATALAALADWQVPRVRLPADPLSGLALPTLPSGGWHAITVSVLTVALVASVESLLCAVAVDRMHDGRKARLDRELTGQGAANAVSGLLGGLPVAGVIVRSSANVRAGARSRASAVMHGVWVLVFTVAFAPLIEQIPLAALAGLLVFIGFKMVSLAHLRNLRRHGEAYVYVITLAGVVTLGLMEGVLLGLGVALAGSLRRLTRVDVRVEQGDGKWHAVVEGSLTCLGVPQVTAALRRIPRGVPVDLDLNVDFMDHAAFEAIHAWRLGHEQSGGQVDIDEVHEDWYELAATGVPPVRKSPPGGIARWWAPWPSRRRGAPGRASSLLVAGAREYQTDTARRIRPLMRSLAPRQRPTSLFITCADSRVVPNLITASGPGDLFTVRNVGNLVPRYRSEPADDSVTAAVEFAVRELGVASITVCGHSRCGAMTAVLGGGETGMVRLDRWLEHAHHSLARFLASSALDADELGREDAASALDRLCRANVVQQLDNLLTYPDVRTRVAEGRLELVGMYYDIANAQMYVLDRNGEAFHPVTERRPLLRRARRRPRRTGEFHEPV